MTKNTGKPPIKISINVIMEYWFVGNYENWMLKKIYVEVEKVSAIAASYNLNNFVLNKN